MPILAVPRHDLSKFERMYFLEAETEGRTNVRKITIGDNGRASVNGNETDSDDVAMDENDVPEEEPDTENNSENDGTGTDVAMEPDDDDMSDDETDEGNKNNGAPDDTVDNDDNGGGDDVTLEPEDDGSDTDAGNDQNVDDADTDDEGSDNSDATDAIRKRALFSRIDGLYEAMGKYTEKLNMLMSSAADDISMYRKACDDLDDLKVYTYDYMIVKFSKATYTESMLFYQRILTALNLILEQLSISVANLKKEHENEQNAKTKKNTQLV